MHVAEMCVVVCRVSFREKKPVRGANATIIDSMIRVVCHVSRLGLGGLLVSSLQAALFTIKQNSGVSGIPILKRDEAPGCPCEVGCFEKRHGPSRQLC